MKSYCGTGRYQPNTHKFKRIAVKGRAYGSYTYLCQCFCWYINISVPKCLFLNIFSECTQNIYLTNEQTETVLIFNKYLKNKINDLSVPIILVGIFILCIIINRR